MWWLVTWPVTGHYLNHSWLIVHWYFLNNSEFTLLKPSLLWSASFIKTLLSGNVFHTAGTLCGIPLLIGGISSQRSSVWVFALVLASTSCMMSWKWFLHCCPFVWGTHKHQWIPLTNGRQRGLSFDASVNNLLNKQLKWHQSQNFVYAHAISL